MLFLYIHWRFEPEIFPNSSIQMRWYGVLFALAFVVAYIILYRIFKKEKIEIKLLDSLAFYIAIGTILGARLGHCLFYEPTIYLKHPVRILQIWEGGLASHGAAIGILLALWLFSQKHKLAFGWLLDRLVIAIPLSGAFVRLGNLANSEIYGKVTSLPWGFYFHNSLEFKHRFEPHHPTQLYEALSYVLITLILWLLYKKGAAKKRGTLFGVFLVLLFSIRFLIEFVKEPQVAFEDTIAFNMGQLLSLPFILAGIIVLVVSKRDNVTEGAIAKGNVPVDNIEEQTE